MSVIYEQKKSGGGWLAPLASAVGILTGQPWIGPAVGAV